MSTQNPFDGERNPNQPAAAGPYGTSPYGAPMHPVTPPPKRTNTWLIAALVAVATLPVMCVCAGVLLPAVGAAREAARRMSCSNNLKQIGLALHNYHANYGSLPPAYTVDADGKPLHSWRTLILPFVEQEALYNSIDLTKPWDDPVNRQISETLVPTYHCPSSGSESVLTQYVAVVDPAGMMTGATSMSFADAKDGLSNTLLILEVDRDLSVPWMSPQDALAEVFLDPTASGRSSSHSGGTHVLMADGAIRFLDDSADLETRKQMLNRSDSAGLELHSNLSGKGQPGERPGFEHQPSGAVFAAPSNDWILATGTAAKNYNPECSAALLYTGDAQHGERMGILIIESLADIDTTDIDLKSTADNLVKQMGLKNKQLESMDELTDFGVPVVRYTVVGDADDTGRLRYECSVLVKNEHLFQVIAFGMAADTPAGDTALEEIHDALRFP